MAHIKGFTYRVHIQNPAWHYILNLQEILHYAARRVIQDFVHQL